MTQKNNLTMQNIAPGPLKKQMLIGAGIALIPITLFLMGTGEPNPEWSKFWMLRPLIIVPIAGATGGACYYILVHHLLKNQKVLAIILSVLIYFIGLWLGTVLGLAGTYWD
jgi:hypothetical protein